MVLKRKNEFQSFDNVKEIDITPNEQEALIVKKIELYNPSLNDYMEINVGKATVGYFPTAINGNELFKFQSTGEANKNYFDVLKEHGLKLTYPVATGEHFILKLGSNVEKVKVIYDVYDGTDIKPDMPNGSKSDTLTFMNVITNSKEITESGYYTLDKSLNPKEMPDFPVDVVPPNFNIKIHSIGFLPVAVSVGDGTNTLGTSYTEYLRMFYKRQVLFDPNRAGFNVLADKTFTTTSTTKTYNYTEMINDLPYVESENTKLTFFDNTLRFNEGDELNIQVKSAIDPDVTIEPEKILCYVLQTISTK